MTNFISLRGLADFHTAVSPFTPSAGKMSHQIKFISEFLQNVVVCVVVQDFLMGCKTPKILLMACNQTPIPNL
jgi:hypothetical protein